MRVVLMNGCAGVGKGTVVGMMKSIYQKKILEFSHINWAKDVVQYVKGDVEKNAKYRQLLQDLERCFTAYDDHPHKVTRERILKARKEGYELITVDIRDPKEMLKIQKACIALNTPCYVLTVRNEKAEKAAQSLCENDNKWMDVRSDFVVFNNGDYKALVNEVIDKLTKLVIGSRRKGTILIPASVTENIGSPSYLEYFFSKAQSKVSPGSKVDKDLVHRALRVEAYSILFEEQKEGAIETLYSLVFENGIAYVEEAMV